MRTYILTMTTLAMTDMEWNLKMEMEQLLPHRKGHECIVMVITEKGIKVLGKAWAR